jgi:hypothetical protein
MLLYNKETKQKTQLFVTFPAEIQKNLTWPSQFVLVTEYYQGGRDGRARSAYERWVMYRPTNFESEYLQGKGYLEI